MNYVFSFKKSDIDLFSDHYGVQPEIPLDTRILMIFKMEDVTLTLYNSFKAMLQGKNAYEDYLMWSEILGFEITEETVPAAINVTADKQNKSSIYFTSSIGSDEVGTGDFFGPVVVASAFVDKSMIPALEAMRIRDSKLMTDDYIMSIGSKLKSMLTHIVLVTDNVKFNDLTKQGFNMNKIKAYLHNHAIKKCVKLVTTPMDHVILDQFCSPKLYFEYLNEVDTYKDITFLEKAESAHLSVAAASIIARYTFITHMQELNHLAGLNLPYGAGPGVDAVGQVLVLKKGIEFLSKVAKINFKNYERIIRK
jgi:ribonuclease HIII